MDKEAEDRVRNRAYEIWEMEGCPNGLDREHWDKAIKELSYLAAAVATGSTAKSGLKKGTRLPGVAKNPELRRPTQGRARDAKSPQAIVAH
jgi:Protein of unknown function (DUF2934)